MSKNGNGTYPDDGNRTSSVCKRVKQGNQRFPGKNKKLHYKRRGWVVKKGQGKKRETQERRDFLDKLSEKSVEKRKY